MDYGNFLAVEGINTSGGYLNGVPCMVIILEGIHIGTGKTERMSFAVPKDEVMDLGSYITNQIAQYLADESL